MPNISACRKCGSTEVVKTLDSTNNRLRVSCKDCGAWIKWEGIPVQVKDVYSIDEQITELKSTIGMLDGLFKRWVEIGKMPHDKMNRKLGILQTALKSLESIN